MATIFDKLFPVAIPTHDFDISGIRLIPGIFLVPVFYLLYFVIFDIVAGGRSAGKSISGIVVVSKTGEALSMRKRLLRCWYKMLVVLLLPVVVAIVFIDDDYAIQDYPTDTRTIRSR